MPKSSQYYSESGRVADPLYDSRELEPVTPYSENLKDEYDVAKSTLEELRQREELVRKRAEQLGEITDKEERFSEGQADLIRQIESYLDLLHQEAADARYLADQCNATRQRFHHHLKSIEGLRPSASDRSDLNLELDHAIRQIEAAEADVENSMPLINQLQNRKSPAGSPKSFVQGTAITDNDFLYWMKAGLAFTLPLMALIITVLIMLFSSNKL